MMILVMKYCR